MTLRLALPREAQSVPVVRRVLKHALQAIKVEAAIISDIELALTEAVTNVLDHAGGTEEYEVVAGIHGDRCTIEVIDRGVGFEPEPDRPEPHQEAEEGRGLLLMKAVADRVEVVRAPTVGTIVRIEKHLVLREDAPLR
jgi:serine/threonine-protein kinase RsbW